MMYEIEGFKIPSEEKGAGRRGVLIKAIVCMIVTAIGMIINNRWMGTPILVLSLIFLGWSFPKGRRLALAIFLALSIALLISLPVKDFIASEFGQTIREGTLQWLVGFLIVALPAGILIVGLPLLALMLVGSEYILALNKDPYNCTRRDSLRILFSLIFQTNYPWIIVADGEAIQAKPAGFLEFIGGTGVVVIRPGNAVVFERGGKVSRVEGPGIVLTKRYEHIEAIVDLRLQFVLREVENVLTHDRVPLKLTLGITFQIESKKDVDARPESHIPPDGEALSRLIRGEPYLVYEATIRKAVYNVTEDGWQATIPGASESIIRDIILTYDLDQIFDLSGMPTAEGYFPTKQRTIEQIEKRANKTLKEICLRWGVRYDGVDLRVIEMPDEVRERMLAVWETEWRSKIKVKEAEAEKLVMLEQAEGKARTITAMEKVKFEAMEKKLSHILEVLTKAPDEVGIRFIRVVEQLSKNMVTDDIIATRYIEALETMARSSGQKAFFLSTGGEAPALRPGRVRDISEDLRLSEGEGDGE